MVFDLFWDLYQDVRINEVSSEARQVSGNESRLRSRVIELEERVNRMTMINRAIWELLGPRLGLTDKDLSARVQEIDLRDGVADGRMSVPKVQPCPQCNRPNATGKLRCLYCGHALEHPTGDFTAFNDNAPA